MAAITAPWPAAVGVSGGSDSLALMFLLRDWASTRRLKPPTVLCVDHGVRPESAEEASRVVRSAREAGLPARVLKGSKRQPKADLEAACRNLRYQLIGDWAVQHKIGVLYVAHTRDDQAETFLLRLARGSGVDGLSAMRPVAPYPVPGFRGLSVARPLLEFERDGLRRYLEAKGHGWLDDPMNSDPRFVRARVRTAWPHLEALGLTKARLAETAKHLGRARAALDVVSRAVVASAFVPWHDGVVFDPAALTGAPREVALRALASMLMVVGGRPYRPRFERLEALMDALAARSVGGGRTLHGCRIAPATAKSALFGSATLLILPEKGRQAPRKGSVQKPIGS